MTVQVWILDLAGDPHAVAAATALLDTAERERARAFRFDADRRRFVLSRAALRCLLGAKVGVAPTLLRFTRSPAGRPRLLGTALDFSFSRSGEWAALAAGAVPALGIDIEAKRLPPGALDVARQYFAAAEYTRLEGLEGEALRDAFFRVWTRKESVLKARGTGLDEASLRELVVSLDESPGIEAGAAGEYWQLSALELPSGYEGCLAIRDCRVSVAQSHLSAAALAFVPDGNHPIG